MNPPLWSRLPAEGRLFESARWLSTDGAFQWVDILGSRLFRWYANTGNCESVTFDFEFLPLATPTSDGIQIIASRETIYEYAWGRKPEPLATLPVGTDARLNDGIVGPDGTIWIGSMALRPHEHKAKGKLWRITRTGEVTQVLDGIGISNGLVWRDSISGYYTDSLTRCIESVRVDKLRAISRSRIATVPAPGEPDGLTLHGDGLFAALWGAGEVIRLDLGTQRIGVTTVPSQRPSSIAISDTLVLLTSAGGGPTIDSSGAVFVSELQPFLAAFRDTTTYAIKAKRNQPDRFTRSSR